MKRLVFNRNVELDAALVYAGLHGGLGRYMLTARSLGIETPDDAFWRARWLKRQPEEYIAAVSDRVVELEHE